MVINVRLEGLNIVKARGRWYVYPRGGGDALIKGFDGTRDELIKKLGEPDLIQTYNRPRLQKRSAADFGADTLGGSIHWYTNGDIDRPIKEAKVSPGTVEGCYPKWSKLADATRVGYLEAYDYLRPEFDMPIAGITQPMVYDVLDKAAVKKWPSFANHLKVALSSMFKQAVKRGKMPFNVCIGIEKPHKSDPNANREWTEAEWQYVHVNAPLEVLIPCMIARYAGLRGQTIVKVRRQDIEDHPITGKAVRYTARKNKKTVLLPVLPELQLFLSYLAEGKVQRADGLIAVREDGSAWSSEDRLQVVVSIWLRQQERAGHIGAGTTLHGLRVTYAAWWKRNGATNREVADLIGDSSEAMGAHYTRHVDAEVNIIRAFNRIKNTE